MRKRFWNIVRNVRLRRMLKRNGLHHARNIVRESSRTGCPLAIACAIFQKESWGRNIFGCDFGFHDGCPYCHQPVSKSRVQNLQRNCWPKGMFNGIGPGQLTSKGYVVEADKAGGSWRAKINIRITCHEVNNLVHRFGNEHGMNAWNGDPSGAYGRDAERIREIWQHRINAVLH